MLIDYFHRCTWINASKAVEWNDRLSAHMYLPIRTQLWTLFVEQSVMSEWLLWQDHDQDQDFEILLEQDQDQSSETKT